MQAEAGDCGFMTKEIEISEGIRRMTRLSVVIACGLVILVIALFRVQIVNGAFYDQRLRSQSLRSIKLPAPRGRIFDRNHVLLADNSPNYGIALYFQELRRDATRSRALAQVAMETVTTLSASLQLPLPRASVIRNHLNQKPAVPLIAWSQLPPEIVAAFAEQHSTRRGVELAVSAIREYPRGTSLAHLLGYVGRKQDNEEDERAYYLQPEMAGMAGLEKALDDLLRGEPGGRIVPIDAMGFAEGSVSEIAPVAGRDVVLTIDARVQAAAEGALANAPLSAHRPVRGAAVVVDVTNGEVLALASSPSYDPNLFSRGMTQQQYDALVRDEGKPFLNRAVQSAQPPGSIFKPFVMLAMLEAGVITPQSHCECRGGLHIGQQYMRCHAASGHGRVGASDAMKFSCDVFFYEYGMKLGVLPIKRMAEQFGCGSPTGAPLAERRGFLPDPDWLRQREGMRWTDGRTANVAIGQGEVLTTPLQMAMATAALANGGVLFEPGFVLPESPGQRTTGKVRGRISARKENLEFIKRTMFEVVEGGGTGGRARISGIRVAGKTGTAEVGRPEARRHIAWFIAFAPYEQPKYAVVVMVEDGDHGGTTAAPVAGKILAAIFNSQQNESTASAGD
jgi:penicillin-binding protein 2